MVIAGEKAPDVALKDSEGNLVKLTDFKGKEVVLYFYPKDDTPGCTAEACSFRDSYGKFLKKGIAVLGVSRDTEKSHKKFREKYSLPFPLLSDPDALVCKAYGAWGKKKFMGREYEGIIRMTFLIDKKGVIGEVVKEIVCDTHGADIFQKV